MIKWLKRKIGVNELEQQTKKINSGLIQAEHLVAKNINDCKGLSEETKENRTSCLALREQLSQMNYKVQKLEKELETFTKLINITVDMANTAKTGEKSWAIISMQAKGKIINEFIDLSHVSDPIDIMRFFKQFKKANLRMAPPSGIDPQVLI